MKKILYILIFSTKVLQAQKLPKFENDTLYTTSGYKIYKGQKITFAEGTRNNGYFSFVKIRGGDNPQKLKHKSIIVEKVSDFYISGLGNSYIKIHGSVIAADGIMKPIKFKLIFEKAISGDAGHAPEIIVPEEFKPKSNGSTAEEIARFYKLYQDGIITKEEFEKQKKKLIEQ